MWVVFIRGAEQIAGLIYFNRQIIYEVDKRAPANIAELTFIPEASCSPYCLQ